MTLPSLLPPFPGARYGRSDIVADSAPKSLACKASAALALGFTGWGLRVSSCSLWDRRVGDLVSSEPKGSGRSGISLAADWSSPGASTLSPRRRASDCSRASFSSCTDGSFNWSSKLVKSHMQSAGPHCLPCTHTHSDCAGTPSAAGRGDRELPSAPSPCEPVTSDLSSPQNDGRVIGAGVTGRLGRSTSVGKSVNLRPRKRPLALVPGGESTLLAGVPWLLPRRCCWRPST
jgi:hypothetical protein